MSWEAEAKFDLIMEVWEKLDCEDVGRVEIEAIRSVLDDRFSLTDRETPMKLARLLADEGAVLRHSEILKYDVEVRRQKAVAGISSIATESREAALGSLRAITSQFRLESDNPRKQESLRKLALSTKEHLLRVTESTDKSAESKARAAEIAEWISIWLQSPDMFEAWIDARMRKREGA